MITINEKVDLTKIIEDYYSYKKLVKDGDSLFLYFDRMMLRFSNVLILKCGYPNEEIFMHLELYFENELSKHKIYEISNSKWIGELNNINKVHPRHSDLLFLGRKHYLIFFEDETFECIADNFDVLQNEVL